MIYKILILYAIILSFLVAIFTIVFFIGESSSFRITSLTVKEIVSLILYNTIVIGNLIATRWKIKGGLITILGVIGFYLLEFYKSNHSLNLIFLVLGLPGIFLLILELWHKRCINNTNLTLTK